MSLFFKLMGDSEHNPIAVIQLFIKGLPRFSLFTHDLSVSEAVNSA